MISSKWMMQMVLLFPLVAIAALSGYRILRLSTGAKVTLPIHGYDPRDLLSGHYIRYRIDYGVPTACSNMSDGQAYICLENRTFTMASPGSCKFFIRGACRSQNFEAGIERYYVSESEAKSLEALVQDPKQSASIVVSVSPDGTAQVKDLFINGKPWK